MRILVIDVGGTHVKVLATGQEERVEIRSGPRMTPAKMIAAVKDATVGWEYDAISIGSAPRVRGPIGPFSSGCELVLVTPIIWVPCSAIELNIHTN